MPGDADFEETIDDQDPTEEEVLDDNGIAIQRYNSQLPPSYRSCIPNEGKLMLRALHVLAAEILKTHQIRTSDTPTTQTSTHPTESDELNIVAEGYEDEMERDFAALEKGICRYLDLKHLLPVEDYPFFVKLFMRGALSPKMDMGLRSKLARIATRLMLKRQCVLPDGVDWRPIANLIRRVHIDCITGGPFIGRDIRDSHCRNMISLLNTSRNFLVKDDSSEKIWNHFAPYLDSSDFDVRFQELLFLVHILPTRGDVWCDWEEQAMKHWQSVESSDWDAVWMTIISRVTIQHPGKYDWSPHLSHIYSRLVKAFHLPLGAIAPQSPIERRCPHHCLFLLDLRMVHCAPAFVINTLSPQRPETMEYFERLFALIANYFHPSNGGRWSGALGTFLTNTTSFLCSRVCEERKATKAGVMDRVFSSKTQKAICSSEHRLSEESIEKLVKMFLPIIQQALHSKYSSMALQASSSARDLAIIAPHLVLEPFLMQISEGLESVSSPHRTTAALRLLTSITPVFMDKDFFPNGNDFLPQIFMLTLPGIDPNDPTKTDSTLRFIAAAAGRLQSIVAAEPDGHMALFLDEYIHQLLERIFSLLDSLEAPPKKGRSGSSGGSSQLSYYIFSVAIENLFAALPSSVAIRAAQRVARQLTGAACINGIKFYAALLRFVAAAAASASNGSSVNIFIPLLIDQILEESPGDSGESDYVLLSIGEDEMVWRIRMLAQACRTVGTGLTQYCDKISKVIMLAMEKPARPIYKAGGRLLRGYLEGLTATRMMIGTGKDTDEDSTSDGESYNFEWKSPSPEEWKCAEDMLETFISHAEKQATSENNDNASHNIAMDRDVLFRVLRLLHAIQRGGRWVFAGAMPKRYRALDKYLDGALELPKADAKLILKRPVVGGLGGERDEEVSADKATQLWTRVYSLTSSIISAVLETRPDDGALLYRSLEPIELAHEPFRKSNPSRQPLQACRAYKGVYKPIISSKRPFHCVGGTGRAMPRFILKLRIEAHHEMRLSIAARGGMRAEKLNRTIIHQLTDVSINDFPRVRGEARGVLTRALRFARPSVRVQEVLRLVDVLNKASLVHKEGSSGQNMDVVKPVNDGMIVDTAGNDVDSGTQGTPEKGAGKDGDVMYEKIMGASAVLKSSAVAPMIMRDWKLFTCIIQALLHALLRAERADAAAAVGSLFTKLAAIVRPLSLEPIGIVEEDMVTEKQGLGWGACYEEERKRRIHTHEELNSCLLGALDKTSHSLKQPQTVKNNGETDGETKKNEAHWRLQSLVATVLYIILREDKPTSPEVAKFFIEGIASDVVTLRQISTKAIMFILAVQGRRDGEEKKHGVDFDDSPGAYNGVGNEDLGTIGKLICESGFARKVVHTLALDHDSDSGRGSSAHFGGGIAVMNLSRMVDGDACWLLTAGRPWPSSWLPRSRDFLSIIRIRLYESFVRVYGIHAFNSFIPVLNDFVEKLQTKKEKIISGVKDEDVRVLAGELLAGVCRGLDLAQCSDGHAQEKLQSLTISLLEDMTGRTGNVTGGTIVRLIATANDFTVGSRVSSVILEWLLRKKPIIVPMGQGPVAHVQARRLRYMLSAISDMDDSNDNQLNHFIGETIADLTGEEGFNHEMKTVREELARCLALIAVVVPKESTTTFAENLGAVCKRLGLNSGAEEQESSSQDDGETNSVEDEKRKSRSRQGETLSRFVSIAEWGGRGSKFAQYIPEILPCLFASFDESDRERINHVRMALSFVAQGRFSADLINDIIASVEMTSKDKRWKVRSSVLAFLQVFSFVSLFTASSESLKRIRAVVLSLLADTQLEVRQAAASVFVTMIRDSKSEEVDEMREECMRTLKSTTPKGRGSKRKPMTPDTLRKRHGAVLGLSSMVTSSPYSVPNWLPSVLVALSGCVNDPPPISTGVRELFADFMRTHRDEWQTHKQAFTPDELDIVSELMISPSYYA